MTTPTPSDLYDGIQSLQADNDDCLREDNRLLLMHENTIIKYLSDDIRTVKEDVKALLRIIAESGVEGGVEMENRGLSVVVLEEKEEMNCSHLY
jgi:hypothetical protein